MTITAEVSQQLMLAALEQAQLAADYGEVPVGAVVAVDGEIISRAHNLVEREKAISRHAEIVAIEMAAHQLGDWRLNQATLCVTIEPCTMCIGAIKLSRIGTLIIGAQDPSMGACGSLFDLSQDSRVGRVPRVIYDVMSAESSKLISSFFSSKR